MKIATYLHIKGDCNKAFERYKKLFKGQEICKYTYNEHMTKDENMYGKVFHAELKIDNYFIYMSDSNESYEYINQPYKIVVEFDCLQETERVFNELKINGIVNSEITKMPFGPHIGNVTDEFGTTWDLVFCK